MDHRRSRWLLDLERSAADCKPRRQETSWYPPASRQSARAPGSQTSSSNQSSCPCPAWSPRFVPLDYSAESPARHSCSTPARDTNENHFDTPLSPGRSLTSDCAHPPSAHSGG